MARAMLTGNDDGGVYSTYYTEDIRFDHVSVGLLTRPPAKILDIIVYSGLYTFSSRTGTDPVLTAIAFKQCMAVGWGKKATKNGCFLHDLTSERVLEPVEE